MFIEIPANKQSISNRKTVFGVGINDADYVTQPRINDRQVTCPFYAKWHDMIKRCYHQKTLEKRPSYIGCSICDEWLYFSNFKSWMAKQDWDGMHLDKDIITPGNKIYSPDNCCFVTGALNMLLTDHAADRGIYPQGVDCDKRKSIYRSRVNYNGNSVYLGSHSTPELASAAYIRAKTQIILEEADNQENSRIANGLRQHAKLLNQ